MIDALSKNQDSLEQLELRRDGLSKQKWMASSPQEASSEISNLLSAISCEI